jgi:hypothetical protein
MRPKHVLWMTFGVIFSTWYSLDPAAHSIGDTSVEALRVGIAQGAHQAVRESGVGVAMM